MKFSKLVQALMYMHTDRRANPSEMEDGIFYRVPHIFQQHANLCTDASMNMLYNLGQKPLSSLSENPRDIFEGRGYQDLKDFKSEHIILNNFPPETPEVQTKRINEEFRKVLEETGPFILDIGLKFGGRHSVLVTGISKDNLIFNDPLTGANRTLTIQELGSLYGRRAVPFIEIAKPNFLTESQRQQCRVTALPQEVEIIKDPKYQQYFTLHKMESPCDALKDFLADIIKRGKCTTDEKIKLNQFLEDHKETNNIVRLTKKLEELFPEQEQSEKLSKRLQAVFHFMNIPNDDGVLLASMKIPAITPRTQAAAVNGECTEAAAMMAKYRQAAHHDPSLTVVPPEEEQASTPSHQSPC